MDEFEEERPRSFPIIFRYLLLLLIGLFGMNYIYAIFSPITAYPVFYMLKLFFPYITLNYSQLLMYFNGTDAIKLVDACIGGSAYFLLLILNLSTSIPFKKRIKSLLFLILCFLIINIIRIVVFSVLFFYKVSFFDISHILFWYFGSTIFVVILWFFNVKIFKIKEIPVYSDVKFLNSVIKSRKKYDA